MTTTATALTNTAWVDLGPTPMVVYSVSDRDSARLVVADAAPASLDTGGLTLSTRNVDGLTIYGTGQHVYARATNHVTTVVVLPFPASGGGGGTANPYPGSDYANTAKQDTGNTTLGNILTRLGTSPAQDGADPASPVVANAGTGIRGWLATIAGSLKLGQQASAASRSITVASDDAAFGTPANTAYAGTGNKGLIGLLKGLYVAAVAPTPAGTNLIGKVNVSPQTTGGVVNTPYLVTSTTPTPILLKNSAAQVYALNVWNSDTVGVWLKLFNKASAPTLGTDIAIYNLYVPPGTSPHVSFADIGLAFGTGLGFAITGGPTPTDNSALASTSKCGLNIAFA